LTSGILLDPSRHADASRLRNALQASSDVHAITKDVATLDDHVALVDTNPELDALVRGHLGVPLSHPALNLDSAAEGVHDTRELHEHTVAGGLHDPTTVLGDLGVYESAAMGLELGERPFFVSAHEAAVSGHVSGQDRCKPTLYAVGGGGQGGAPGAGRAIIP